MRYFDKPHYVVIFPQLVGFWPFPREVMTLAADMTAYRHTNFYELGCFDWVPNGVSQCSVDGLPPAAARARDRYPNMDFKPTSYCNSDGMMNCCASGLVEEVIVLRDINADAPSRSATNEIAILVRAQFNEQEMGFSGVYHR